MLRSSSPAFSLIEVLVAMCLVSALALGVAPLFATATSVTALAGDQTSATLLASAKLEQLFSLAWHMEVSLGGASVSVSDTTTDLSGPVPVEGGTGLSPSPADALSRNSSGFVDFLDRDGRWLSADTSAPPGAYFVRRWSIARSTAPGEALALQVLVRTRARDVSRAALDADVELPGDTRLAAVRVRRLR